MKQSEQNTTRKKEELNDEIAVRLVPQGCFGGGTVHWGGRPWRHRGQALRYLQSLDEVWPCVGGGGTEEAEAALPGEGSASQGGSAAGLEATQGIAPQHPVRSGGSLERVGALWEVGGKENGWENIMEGQVR